MQSLAPCFSEMFDNLLEFLRQHRAWAEAIILLWGLIETDLIFLVIGALAHSGVVHLASCVPVAILGALLHDTVVFWLSKNRADWVRARKAYQRFAPSIEKFANKTGQWQLSICRPLYGTRYPTIIFWGLQSLSYTRFYISILAGLLPWAAVLLGVGFTLSNHLDDFDDWLLEAKHWILGGIAVIALIAYVLHRLHRNAPSHPKSGSESNSGSASQQSSSSADKIS